MKTLATLTAVWTVLTVLGFTAYFDDPNPWNGWFVPLWFGSLAAALTVLSAVGITRALSEIASGEVDRRRRERAMSERIKQ